jgi:hypothetical protein
MTDAKPKALQLVEESENGDWIVGTGQWREEAAAELRRLHEENTALRQAIEQAEKLEPVAWEYQEYRSAFMGNLQWFDTVQFVQPPNDPELFRNIKPLFTSPPRKEWVGLTDEEMSEIYNKNYDKYDTDMTYMDFFMVQREVEAKLKEKNGGS